MATKRRNFSGIRDAQARTAQAMPAPVDSADGAAQGIVLPGEGPRGEAPDGNGQADEVRSPTTGPPVLTLNQGRHTRRTFRHLLEDTDT